MNALSSAPTYEFNFKCPQDLCHYASELCLGIPDVDSVLLRYKDDEHFVEQPYALAVFSRQANIGDFIRKILSADDAFESVPEITCKTIEDADWAEAWKAYWDVDSIIENKLTICPSWKTHTPVEGEVVLHLDPGSAFGTGAHETTRLMLQRLYAFHEEMPLKNTRLLDLGCGSGILAIYAAKLGASPVLGLDIDAQAVAVSQENACLNQVEHLCTFSDTPLQAIAVPTTDEEKYPIMLINILGPVIMELLPTIQEHLQVGGRVICSGLIEKSCQDLAHALEHVGFQITGTHQLNQWFALEATYSK
jgi:ribosomal protein L11 methyltransferase